MTPETTTEAGASTPPAIAARWSRWVSALVLLGAGLLMTHGPILLTGFRWMHGEAGDTRLIVYLLEHGWQWLTGGELHRSFWDPPMFFPAKNTLAYSELLIGSAPLYWIWRAAGALPDTAFQLWLLSVSTANFLLALALLRRGLRLAPWASAAGAFLFAFGAPRVAQSGHFQLFPQFPMVLFVWAVLESVRASTVRARRSWIFVAAAAAVVQLYAGFYLGWFLALGAVLVLGIALGFREERAQLWAWLRGSAGTLAVAGVLAVLAIVPMALGYARAADEVGLREFREVMKMLPRPASWILMSVQSWLYGGTADWPLFGSIPADFRHEHQLGIGPLTTLLAVYGLWLASKRPGLRLWAWLAVTIVASTLLLPKGVTLWGAFYAVFPGAKALRAMTRIVLALLVPLAIGVAVALDRVERARARRFAWLAAPLLVLSVVEQGQDVPAYDKLADRERLAWLAAQVPADCESFYLTPVYSRDPWYVTEIDAILVSDRVGIPTVNGYSGNVPTGFIWPEYNQIHQHEDRTNVGNLLKDWSHARGFTLPDRCWVRVTAYGERLDAEPVTVTVDSTVAAGEPFSATMTFRNTGTVPWERRRHFRLGAVEADGAKVWGVDRVELPADVPAGGEVTVTLPLRAPAQPGRHPFRWQLMQEWMAWFGPVVEAPVEVVAPSALRAP